MKSTMASRLVSENFCGGMAEPGVALAGAMKCFFSHSGERRAPTLSSSGPMMPPAPPSLWQPRQPLFSKTCSPWANSGAAGLSAASWHWPQEAWMYFMGSIGSSQCGTLPCASAAVVARPWPRWQMVQPNFSKGCCSCSGW